MNRGQYSYQKALRNMEALLEPTDPTPAKRETEQPPETAGPRPLARLEDIPQVTQRWSRPANAFPDGQGRMPNNPLVAAGLGAIWKGGPNARQLAHGWTETEQGEVRYQHNGSKGGRILVFPQFLAQGGDPKNTTENCWSYVAGLSPLTADVVCAVLAQMAEPGSGDRPKYPMLQPVLITTEAVQRYRGIQRWGEERSNVHERLFQEMEKLRVLSFNVEQFPTINPRTNKSEAGAWQGDRLFDIIKVERWEHPTGTRIEVAWSVRAGQWAYYWLNAQGRVYLARMAKALLELDHRGTALTKKLGQRIVLLAGAVSNLRSLRIGGLLEDVGELPLPQERGEHWAGRMRERFDQAMLDLQQTGIFTHVVWPDGHGPGAPRPGRGWVGDWLGSSVQITLPDANRVAGDVLPAIANETTPPEFCFEPGAVHRMRLQLGWKQEQLAGHLCISRKHLSLLENGRATPSDELAARLHHWLTANALGGQPEV